jgi:gentisate 1,2-dioxygenase
MPTIATFVQLLPASFASQPYRSTDGTVFVVVEGKGETRIGDTVFRWEPHDIFVVPSWMEHTHHALSETVLFSFSDRVVQEKLGLWREARGNA